jgi:hypothetical protein
VSARPRLVVPDMDKKVTKRIAEREPSAGTPSLCEA